MNAMQHFSRVHRIPGSKGRGRSSSNSPILLNRERNLSEPSKPPEEMVVSKPGGLPSVSPISPPEEKPIVNLQYVLTIEDKLWSILECLRVGDANRKLCEEYWEISEESPMPMLETLFHDVRTKRCIRRTCVIEVTSLALCHVCFQSLADTDRQHFRNLIYYVHQNYLSCMKLLLFRTGANAGNNTWVDYMKETIKQKQVAVPQRGGQSGFMRQHNEVAVKILENLSSIVTGPIQHCLLVVLHSLNSLNFTQARLMLVSALASMPDIPEMLPTLELEPPCVPANTSKIYTLVLDLDETLVHYMDAGEDSKLMVRPGCTEFIEEMSKYYELVIFTAALQDYADWAIDLIDPDGYISHRLYRQHTLPNGPIFVKDLSALGRDLRKTIIVDNVADNFRLQQENGIFIKSWFDDEYDKCLYEIIPLLREISIKQVDDVRVALRHFRDQVLRQLVKGVSNPLVNFHTTKTA